MKNLMKHVLIIGGPLCVMAALLISVGLMGSSCDTSEEAEDDFSSEVACRHYCDKKFDCADQEPTDDERDTCIGDCRNDIEDECGNDNQQAANDKIEECVDLGCDEFWVCMVFEAAPECFGFVNNDTE